MSTLHRRDFLRALGGVAGLSLMPPAIQRALAIPANSRTGTINDVEHVVILMQENRSFDHYFGTFTGVRGFGDRFPIPLASGKPVWFQRERPPSTVEITPYHLDSSKGNAQRVSGTPHGWEDGHFAWFDGRTGFWPGWKETQSMGYYKQAELPFQFALASAFTLCDAYHCSMLTSTNPNRLFLFTGMNNPTGVGGGPAIDNTNDDLGPSASGYNWTTYAERLQAAGIDWKVYQDMGDNFTDNSLEGFVSFRRAFENRATDPNNPLLLRGLTSTLSNNSLDGLKNDVLAGKLPQVSYVVGPAEYSEHTGPSSPVQGGWYAQQVIEALTADPAVWAKTVLIINFDENDGFFDHMPPPCAPSVNPDGSRAGATTMDDSSERAMVNQVFDKDWVYGPGMRVPCYVVSPFSRGGWVNSQVFDHTSVVQFLEKRFGVAEPNISAYRRAVCGDLLSCFNFANPNDEAFPTLPILSKGEADALRSQQQMLAQIPSNGTVLPKQDFGVKPSRALPYELHVSVRASATAVQLNFQNTGAEAAVFHVYNMKSLAEIPRRYAVEPCKSLPGSWAYSADGYDLFVLGPNGFHRRLKATAAAVPSMGMAEVDLCYDAANGDIFFSMHNGGGAATSFTITPNAYYPVSSAVTLSVPAGQTIEREWRLATSFAWYDFTVTATSPTGFSRRFAGRVETGRHGVTDPAMGAG